MTEQALQPKAKMLQYAEYLALVIGGITALICILNAAPSFFGLPTPDRLCELVILVHREVPRRTAPSQPVG